MKFYSYLPQKLRAKEEGKQKKKSITNVIKFCNGPISCHSISMMSNILISRSRL